MPGTHIISLGGSLVVPDQIDESYLKAFIQLIKLKVKRGHKFVLIVGGGKTCRKYQEALKKVVPATAADLDWLGIQATWLNAKLVQLMFGKLSHPVIISDPNKKVAFKEKVLVAGGWKPGRSTDDDAVRLAKQYRASQIINLSNIDAVYSEDPRKNPNASKIEQISWKGFRSMFSKNWNPGANVPFDPTAAALAEKLKLKVIIANGKNLKNLENILSGKNYEGTTIIG